MDAIAGEIAQAFVRIRPNTAGFQSETENGVKKALISVGKITAGFFALRGIADEFKHIEEAATEHQAQFAVLGQTLKNAHASSKVLGTELEKLLEKEATLKGFTDEELASAFTRLVSVTGDSAKAFHALQDAEDVARARHIDVATAALAESRALQGSTISLSRLGVIIPKVTTEQSKLRGEQARFAAEGFKITGQQKLQFQAHLATAAAADAQATKVKALAILEQRFGGSAEAFAKGAAGRIERFSASFHLFEVAIGKAFLPTLAAGTAGLTGWVNELRDSGDAQAAAAGGVRFIRDAFVDLRAIVQTLTPVLRPVVELLADVAKFAGVGGILVAVAAFKAVAVAVNIGVAARSKFIALSTADQASSRALAAAHAADANALAESAPLLTTRADAVQADAAASTRAATATEAYTVALRANSAALVADTEQALAHSRASSTSSLPIAAGGAPISSRDLTLEASAATQGAEAFRELGTAADASGPPVIAATGEVGDLAVGVDSATSVLKEAGSAVTKHSAQLSAAARHTQVLNDAQTAQAATSAKNTAALNANAAAAERLAAANSAAAAGGRVLGASAIAPATGGVIVAEQSAQAAQANSALSAERQTGELASTVHHSTEVFDRASRSASTYGRELDVLTTKETELSAANEKALFTQGTNTSGFNTASSSAKKAALDVGSAERATSRLATTGTRVSSVLRGVGRSIFSFVGGWPTIIAAALGLAAFGIYKLVTAEGALDRANRHVLDSINAIASGLSKQQAATKSLSEDVSARRSERIALVEARIGVERAKNALATSKAGRATLEYRQLVADLASAQDQLRLAERNVSKTEADIEKDRRHRGDAAKDTAEARKGGLRDTLALLREIGTKEARLTPLGAKEAIKAESLGLTSFVPSEAAIKQGEKSAEAAKKFAEGLREDAKKAADEGHTLVARQFTDLANFVKALGKVPDRKIIEIFFKAPKTSAAQTIAAQLAIDLPRAQAGGAKGIAAFVSQLDHERQTIAENDKQLARRIRIFEEIARVAGRRIKPQIIELILRSNVEVGIKRLVAELGRAGVSARTFREELGREAASLSQSNPALARKLLILSQFSALIGRLPNKRETELVFKAPTVLAAATGLQEIISKFKEAGGKSGDEMARQFLIGLVKSPFLRAGLADLLPATAAAAAKSDAFAVAVAKKNLLGQLKTANDAVKTAQDGVDSARDALQSSRDQLADSQRSLVDAIKAGQQQVADAVRSAGANLTSIGGSLSDLVGQFFDEQQARLDAKAGGQQQKAATGPLAERLKRLRALIAEGKGSPELIREAEQVEAELQALADKQDQKKPELDKRKERVQRRLADLTDEFNTGKISLAKFNREVLALLKHEGINYKSAGRLLGVAFADGFRQAIKDIKAQAAAIAKFGRLPGVSGQSDIVRPSEVAKDVAAGIARDQLGVARQQRDVLKDVKTLSAKEATLAKANAKADTISTKIGNLHTSAAKTATHTGITNDLLRRLIAQQKEQEKEDRRARRENRAKPLPAPANQAQGIGLAGGGIVPGVPTPRDSVLAAMSPGEAVLTSHGQSLVDQIGGPGAMNFVLARQRPHFAAGGRLESSPPEIQAGLGPGVKRHWGWTSSTLHGDPRLIRHGYSLDADTPDWCRGVQRHSNGYCRNFIQKFRGGGRPEILPGLGPGVTRHWGWASRALDGDPNLRQHGYQLASRTPDWCKGVQRHSNGYCRNFIQRFREGGLPEIQAGLGSGVKAHWGWPSRSLDGDPKLRQHGYRLAKETPDWCEGVQRHSNGYCRNFIRKFQDGGRADPHPEIQSGLGPGVTRRWGWPTRSLEGEPRLRQHGYRFAKETPNWCEGDQRYSNGYCRSFIRKFRGGGLVPTDTPAHWNPDLRRFVAERFYNIKGFWRDRDYHHRLNPKIPERRDVSGWATNTFGRNGAAGDLQLVYDRPDHADHHESSDWWAGRLSSWWRKDGLGKQRAAELAIPRRTGGVIPSFQGGGRIPDDVAAHWDPVWRRYTAERYMTTRFNSSSWHNARNPHIPRRRDVSKWSHGLFDRGYTRELGHAPHGGGWWADHLDRWWSREGYPRQQAVDKESNRLRALPHRQGGLVQRFQGGGRVNPHPEIQVGDLHALTSEQRRLARKLIADYEGGPRVGNLGKALDHLGRYYTGSGAIGGTLGHRGIGGAIEDLVKGFNPALLVSAVRQNVSHPRGARGELNAGSVFTGPRRPPTVRLAQARVIGELVRRGEIRIPRSGRAATDLFRSLQNDPGDQLSTLDAYRKIAKVSKEIDPAESVKLKALGREGYARLTLLDRTQQIARFLRSHHHEQESIGDVPTAGIVNSLLALLRTHRFKTPTTLWRGVPIDALLRDGKLPGVGDHLPIDQNFLWTSTNRSIAEQYPQYSVRGEHGQARRKEKALIRIQAPAGLHYLPEEFNERSIILPPRLILQVAGVKRTALGRRQITVVPEETSVSLSPIRPPMRRLGGIIPKFGDGGFVDRPTLAIVGDKGPEAMVPVRRGGRIPSFASGGLVEGDGLLKFIAEAEQRRAVVRGETSVTILVDADARPARRALDDLRRDLLQPALRRAFPADGLRGAAPADDRRDIPGGRTVAPAIPRERIGFPAVPPLDAGALARTQRDAMLREERIQTRILQKIEREEAAQTLLLRDVEADVRPRRRQHDGQKNLRVASDRARAAARNNLIGQ